MDADGFANHKVFKPCVASYKTSMDRPDISKACLQTILRAAIAQRRGKQMPASSWRAWILMC